MTGDLICWEALDADAPCVEQARHLYETTLHVDERIPWQWITGAVSRRASWRPGRWGTHLILAGPRGEKNSPDHVLGFANALHIPGYGGYLTYLGVDPQARGQGVGTRLVEATVRAMAFDATCEGSELPFVVWESRPPAPGDEASAAAWRAKLGLWRRSGAFWVAGLTFYAVNYMRKNAPAVRLALFLRPVATPATDFTADALREMAAGLMREVYNGVVGDDNYQRTLPPDCAPELRQVDEALGLVELPDEAIG
ncbi:MAG: GNAT family N-acetyltransferase [Thermomicrobiales bacterium]